MLATSTERGFTLPELVAVLVITSVLAAFAMPNFSTGLGLRNDGWHDEVVSALRFAHGTAVSHRRLVCASVASNSVTLTIAAVNPATSCATALSGPDGAPVYTSNAIGVVAAVSPGGALYFQPSGRVTSDGAGATVSDRSITISGSDTISLVGETGHVQ